MSRKKSRPAASTGRRCSLQNIGVFTLIDEMLASPTEPWPRESWLHRVRLSRDALERLQSPRPSSLIGSDWAVLTMVCNLVLVLLEQGHVADPDGLLADAKDALQAPLARYSDAAGKFCLSTAEAAIVGYLLDDWQDAMAGLPARIMVRACRDTERRVAAIDSGRPLRAIDRMVSIPS